MSSMYPSFGGAAVRTCMRCGSPLAPNESQCSRCGTYNALPQGQQFGMFQQGAQGGGPGTAGLSWGNQSPQSQFPQTGNGAWPGATDTSTSAWGSTGQAGGWPQNSLFGGQDQQAASSRPNMFGSPNGSGFSGQNQSSLNNSFSNFQQYPGQSAPNNSFNTFQQNPNQSSLNTFFNSTAQQNSYGSSVQNRPAWMARPDEEDDDDDGKKRPGAGVVILIVVLLVALIGGGGFGGYYWWTHRHPTTTAGPTIPAGVQTPSITPLFSDSFQNNNAGWDKTSADGAKVTLAGDGKLVLESDNNKLFPELLPGGKTFGDLRVDVDAGLTSGDIGNGYGVYIRAASTQNSPLGLYYRFEVYGDGSFVIYKGTQDANGNSQSTALKLSPPNDAIAHEGKLNHLTIIAKGQQLSFIINNTTVSTFTDNSYKSGTVALFVSNVQKVPAGAQATFEHLAIFPAQ